LCVYQKLLEKAIIASPEREGAGEAGGGVSEKGQSP